MSWLGIFRRRGNRPNFSPNGSYFFHNTNAYALFTGDFAVINLTAREMIQIFVHRPPLVFHLTIG